MTTPNHHEEEADPNPGLLTTRAWRVVTLALAIVLTCVAVALVLLALQASSTQSNADATRKANDELRQELTCRAEPTLEFDRQSTELSALIAEGLAQAASGAFDDPEGFSQSLRDQVVLVEKTLDARERSFTECANENGG